MSNGRLQRHEDALRARLRKLFDQLATWKPAEDKDCLALAGRLQELNAELHDDAQYVKQLREMQADYGAQNPAQSFALIHLLGAEANLPTERLAVCLREDFTTAEDDYVERMQTQWLRIADALGLEPLGQECGPETNGKQKRGPKGTRERDEQIADEYFDGLETGRWSGQRDYLRRKHAKRYEENPNAATSWLSSLLKRVN